MFQPTSTFTFTHAQSILDAGLVAIANGCRAIDFSAVTAADSSAVAVVLAWQRAARKKEVTLVLHNLPASLTSLFALYDVTPLLDIATSSMA